MSISKIRKLVVYQSRDFRDFKLAEIRDSEVVISIKRKIDLLKKIALMINLLKKKSRVKS